MKIAAPARSLHSVALLSLLALLLPATAAAQERLARRLGVGDGLSVPNVFSLAQDSTGFLWVGTVDGLYRYDGVEVRRWAPERIRGRIASVIVPASGRVVALRETGELWRVDRRGASRVAGPGDRRLDDAVDVAPGASGSVWVLREDGTLWRGTDGRGWSEVPSPAVDGAGPRHVFPGRDGGVDVATDSALWRVPRAGPPRKLASLPRVEDVLALPDGSRMVVTFWRETYRLEDRSAEEVVDVPGRGIDLTARDGVVWVSYDRYLARLVPGRTPRVLGPDLHPAGGGPLLVDAEGSLWIGTFSGLVQHPEPRTVFWADAHGLPSAHTRFVERTGDTVWVTTWQGVGRVEESASGWRADTVRSLFTRGLAVTDAEGDVWALTPRGLTELRSGRKPVIHRPEIRNIGAAEPADDGRIWFGGEGVLHRVGTGGYGEPGPGRIRTVDVPGDGLVTALLREGGRTWVGVGERICRTGAGDPTPPGDSGWTCWTVAGADHFSALHRTSRGTVWAASPYVGVLRFRDGGWEPVPAMADLPTRSVLNLVPSPSGGVWVLGHGLLHRLVPDGPGSGWRVAERLTGWHGLPTVGGRDLLEEPDGSLWITTSRGLVRVPVEVRDASPSPPPVALVEARVDGERLDVRTRPELSHDRDNVQLRFAALSYRGPSRVRYQVRLSPRSEWSSTRSQPVVRWTGLDAGTYRGEVRASLDGSSWTPSPPAFEFEVRPPWHLEPRWLAVFAAAAVLLALLGYRARVAHLLGLERQRTRIAMDLHDEVGSALGSVGILAGILREESDDVEHREIAGEIESTVEELGAAVSDLVWALDPKTTTLPDVARRLTERGRRLLTGSDLALETRLPEEWPEGALPSGVRRNLFLIGQEALRNAARHADASRITLAFRRVDGGWVMRVEDDGCGRIPDDGSRPDGGFGTTSMRRRAEAIGARIEWDRGRDGGTGVVVEVPSSVVDGAGGGLLRGLRERWRDVTP